MAYENMKKIISHTIKQIVFIWVSLFVIVSLSLIFYNVERKNTQFMNEQIQTFSEISIEITSVLYYNSQKSIADEIDYTKTLLNQWILLQSQPYGNLIPQAIPEINYLGELGQQFYSKENLQNNKNLITSYQSLSDQLDLLKRMSFNNIQDSFVNTWGAIIPFALIGALLICIVLTFLHANSLLKRLVIKNEFILEDIWNELQGIQLDDEDLIFEDEEIETVYYPGANKVQSLIQESKNLGNAILLSKEQVLNYTPTISTDPQPVYTQTSNTEYPQISEKIIFIQKLLSRLFTRAERSATLAKASSENGFQAGILALNISIEAARSGEIGRNFVPISNRVKDFAEKSNQIGKAIIEELKDMDLSIRKAYAMNKGIAEEITAFSITDSSISGSTNNETPNISAEKQGYLQTIVTQFDQMFELSQYIQTISSELETSIEVPRKISTQHTNSGQALFLKEILLRSFERLYRFNYGIDPPKKPFN